MIAVELQPIVTGHLVLPERYAFRTLGNPLARLKAVCLAFVLRHPAAGVVLVDTGFHPDAGDDRRKDFGPAMSAMFASLKPQPFDRQLRDAGVDPAAVERVVMTHLHVDHTSGMRLLGRARFSIARAEWAAVGGGARKGYVRQHLPPASRIDLVDFDGAHGPFGATADLLGDGSIRLLSTPGHTPGHLSVLVRTRRGEVLLAGDAAYTRRNIREQVLPLLTTDAAAHRRSLAELNAFAEAHPEVPVVPSHDPDAHLEL